MRSYLIAGLGLLLGVSLVWAGDDNTRGQGSATHNALPSNPRPTPSSAPAELLGLTNALPWLQVAVDVSKELAGKDEEPDTKELKQSAATMGPAEVFPYGEEVTRFPRESHVAEYLDVRPWSWYYAPWRVRQQSATVPKHQPQFQDAAPLRELLQDKDAEIRAMAAEALATLRQPEDVARLGRMLEDDAVASPFLGHNMSRSSYALVGVWARDARSAGDGLDLYRSWRKETVAQCVQRALRLMTGQRFSDKAAFEKWWKVNRGSRDCLWYWQERLERELNEADISTGWPRLYQRPDENWERYRARQQALNRAARDEVHKTIAADLRQLAP